MEHTADFPHPGDQQRAVGCGQIADGADTHSQEKGCGRLSHKKQIGDRQGKDDFPIVGGVDDRGGVRFAVVAAQLGVNFIIGYADGNSEAKLFPDTAAKLIGDLFTAAEQPKLPVTSSQDSSMPKGST